MRKLAIVVLAVVAATAAIAISVATSQAKWHILSDTAINTQRLCKDGLQFTWASGQTDVQPPATRPVGQPRWVGPIDLLVQSGPSTLPQDEADWENQPMAGGSVFTADYAPVKNTLTSPASWYPYSHAGVVPFRTPLTPASDFVRIDTQPNGNDSTEVFLPVGNCYQFAPIDVAPGDPANTVDLTPGSRVVVGLMSTARFDATTVAVSSVEFGATGTEASPIASSVADLNHDGRSDLKLTFATGDTGIDSTTTLALLSATDPSSKRTFYESNSVTPING
ncbi:MAG: hypothetical protein ACTHNU_11120 [Gaiellales bacterium]